MEITQFPSSRFDNLNLLAETVGNFFTEIYGGRELVLDFLRGCSMQEKQLEQDASELFDSMGRLTCPPFHTDLWYALDLQESAGQAADLLVIGPNNTTRVVGAQPGSGIEFVVGGPIDPSWQFPTPSTLLGAAFAQDNPVEPAVCLTSGVHFVLDPTNSRIILASNPFQDPRFTPVTDSTGIRHITLHLYAAQWDWQYMQTLYGSVINLPGQASQRYNDFTNAVLDALVMGSSEQTLTRAISAMTDIPLALASETVQFVTSDSVSQLVITDQNVYRVGSGANIIVTVGQLLTAGQQLTDGVTFYKMNDGVPATGLSQLTLTNELLPASIQGPLTFQNQQLPLTVTVDTGGFVKVTFPLLGQNSDITTFFNLLHATGVASGKTLANYLDLRTNPVGQPTALNLPTTVNPMQLLLNVLRYSFVIVVVKQAAMGPNALGLNLRSFLRLITPPHTGLMLQSV